MTEPSSRSSARDPSSRAHDSRPQEYLRIPGLLFDDVPVLIPREHAAALRFLRPRGFDPGLSWERYYALLEPLDRVAHRLVDVFDYSVHELRHGGGGGGGDDDGERAPLRQPAFWDGFFERVLDRLGPAAEEVGMSSADVMWIVFLYTRAWETTPRAHRARWQGYWRRANIHHLHDLLREWTGMLRARRLPWSVVFGVLFGAAGP
ncbi:hypothetical protein EsH8_IV_001367 [Colletotrichum jinshuiense]